MITYSAAANTANHICEKLVTVDRDIGTTDAMISRRTILSKRRPAAVSDRWTMSRRVKDGPPGCAGIVTTPALAAASP